MLTRRRFMGALGLTAAAVGAGLGGDLIRRRRLDVSGLAAGADLLARGDRAVLRAPDGTRHAARVEDVRVTRRPRHGDAPALEEVSLLLAASAPAGVYALESAVVRVDALQYLPVDGLRDVPRLEAVVTRIV